MTEPTNPDYKPGNPQFEQERAVIWSYDKSTAAEYLTAISHQIQCWMREAKTIEYPKSTGEFIVIPAEYLKTQD